MAHLELTEPINRPAADVFRFVATEHVTNHPRWDPEMALVQETPGPIGVGTRIHRTRTRGEARIEGQMEIVEYEPERTLAAVIRDGPIYVRSSLRIESKGEQASTLTITVESDDAPVSMMEEPIRGSLRRIRQLLEDPRGRG